MNKIKPKLDRKNLAYFIIFFVSLVIIQFVNYIEVRRLSMNLYYLILITLVLLCVTMILIIITTNYGSSTKDWQV